MSDDQYEPPPAYDEPQQHHDDRNSPPQDYAAEQSVLGAMMLSKEAIADVVNIVRGVDFYRPANETIFDTIVDLYSTGDPIDPVTVAGALSKTGALMRVGGGPYLHDLTANVPIAANARYYAEIVAEKAVLRRLDDAGARIRQFVSSHNENGGDAAALIDRSQAAVMEAMPRERAQDYVPIADVLDATLNAIEEAGQCGGINQNAVPTGFLDLDDLLTGFLPGQMITVAGRPGLGKSTLALDFLRAASMRNGLASCMFSLEMTRHEITMRLLSAEAKVPLANLRTGMLSENEWNKVAVQYEHVSAAPLFIDDSPNLTMSEIRAKARRLRQRHDLRLIAIDYLQLMTSGKRVESRQVEVSEFSRQIKLLAKELEVPILALSQLNRGPEQRSSKRPMMSDLRESGSIEQDSDVVILLHRDDAYEMESARPGEADLIVAKHRNGATRDVAVAAQLHYSRFADLAHT